MSPAKGTKVWGDDFHLFLLSNTEFMSFNLELCCFLCTKTNSSLRVMLQGCPWLCFLWGFGPEPSHAHPVFDASHT
jgi:hypothetical protein